jgi:hypothetical protein
VSVFGIYRHQQRRIALKYLTNNGLESYGGEGGIRKLEAQRPSATYRYYVPMDTDTVEKLVAISVLSAIPVLEITTGE